MVEVLNLVTMVYSLSTPTGNSRFIISCTCLRGPPIALACVLFLT